MNHPILYGVYAAKFPFLEAHKYKIRPVIVVSAPVGYYGVIAVIPISSKMDKELSDIAIKAWRDLGLLKPSVARVHRLSTILRSKLDAFLGELSAKDAEQLKESMRQFLVL